MIISPRVLLVKIDIIISIFRHEPNQVIDKGGVVGTTRRESREDTLLGTRITKHLTIKGNHNFQAWVMSLEITNLLIHIGREAVHVCDLKVAINIAKGDIKMGEEVNRDFTSGHSPIATLGTLSLLVSDHMLLGVRGRRT
jgi:hypothetical protein